MKFFTGNNRGSSLVEIILAIGFFVAMSTAIIYLVVGALSTTRYGHDRERASFLLHEGIEAVKTIRDEGWLNLTNGTHGIAISASKWTLSGASDVTDKFTRTVLIESVNRDSGFDIVTSGGTLDPRTKKVTITITWDFSPGFQQNISAEVYLSDWNTFDWIEDTDTEFDDGTYNDTERINAGVPAYVRLLDQVSGFVEFIDDTLTEFNSGTYFDVESLPVRVRLDATGLTNGTGTYTSEVFDTGGSADWQTLSWVPTSPYYKELPDSNAVETAYTTYNIDMSDNVTLYHFNEGAASTVFDGTSNENNDGSCSGGSCPVSNVSGFLNAAVEFDGSTDYITTTDDLAQWLGDDATVSFWLKTTQTGNATFWDAPGIAGVEESGGGNDVFWGWIDDTGHMGVMKGNTAGAVSTTAINDDAWHHVVMTRNATSGEVKIWVDGTLEDTATSETGVVTTGFTSIGRIEDTGGSPEYYDGVLDEFAAFDTVLSDEQIAALYRRGALRLKFQVRSCNNASCSGSTFEGPDQTGATYWTELDTAGIGLPSFSLGTVSDMQYVQYQVTFESDNTSLTPELQDVTIDHSLGQIKDETKAEFDTGTYSDTTITDFQVHLTSTGQTNQTGTFESRIFDATAEADWNRINWTPNAPYQKELPGSQQIETAYSSGNINMSTNQALWHFNETAGATTFSDVSGNSNDFTCTNCPIAGATGKFGSALNFDGVDDTLNLGSGASHQIAGDLTISMWLRPDTLRNDMIMSHTVPGESEPTNSLYELELEANGDITYKHEYSAGSDEIFTFANADLVEDEWHHIMLARDVTADTVELYVNGSSVGVFNYTNDPTGGTSTELHLGSDEGPADFADISVDEMAIFNSTFSATDAQSLYARGGARVRFQIRSCNDAACSGETFVGPDGTSGTYYNDLNSTGITLPDFEIQNIPDNQYAQYKLFFDTDSASLDPYISRVELTYAFTGDSTDYFVDDTQSEFDTGTYSDTEWSTDHVQLDATGLTNGSGTYASEVFDAGENSSWDELAWTPAGPYGKELPDNDGADSTSTWWDSSYSYRKEVTFGTAHSQLEEGFTAVLTMDTQTASTNIALANGNDVRIVWEPTVGAAVELDRIGTTWDNASTNISFRLQGQIALNANTPSNGTYYVYYGNGAAGTPPTNEMNVYYFADYFNRADSSTVGNGWTEFNTGGGDADIVSNTLEMQGNNTGPPDAGIKQDFSLGAIPGNFNLEFDWTMPSNPEGLWTHYVNIGNSASMVDSSRTTGVGPGIYNGEGGWFSPNGTENISNDLSGNMENSINGGPYDIRLEVDATADTYDYYRDDVLRASAQTFVNAEGTLDHIRIATDQYIGTAAEFVYDNVQVTLTVADDPEETLGTEESLGAQSGAYTTGAVDMSDNVLLLHLNESSGATSFSDTSGNSNDASCSTCPTSEVSAQFGTGVDYDGTQWIEVPSDASLEITDNLTVAAWVNVDALTTPDHNPILWKGTQIGWGANYMFRIAVNAGGAVTWGVTYGVTEDWFAGGTITLDEWTHVALTYDGSTARGYINGVEVGNNGGGGSSLNVFSSSPIRSGFGYRSTGVEETYLDGLVDEIAIWAKTMTAPQVSDLYERGIQRINFQVRSCDDAACSGETYIGPDGTAGTYYTEFLNSTTSTPDVSLTNVSNNQYFQYTVDLETDSSSYNPELSRVSVGYLGLVTAGPGQVIDDTQTEFDAGAYSETLWSTDHVELTAAGKIAGSGTYTSTIFDTFTPTTTWDTLSWVPTAPYGKELPAGVATETAYTSDNADMTGNVLLMHMNEATGTVIDSSGQTNSGTQSGGVTYGATGKYQDALSFDGVDDVVTVTDAASLDITNTVTIEGWMNFTGSGGGGTVAIGDITDTVVDTLEYDTSRSVEQDIIQISTSVHAIVYQGPGNDGFIKTISVDASGNIGAVIDTLEYDTSNGREPSIINVSGDIYAIAYRDNGADGWVATVDIDSAGNIGSVIDTLEYDTAVGRQPNIFSVSGDIFGIAYQGPGSDGWLVTVDIDSSGNIANSVIDSVEFDTNTANRPDVIGVGGDFYAIAYQGPGNDGFIKTYEIDNAGNITGAATDTYEFDTGNGREPEIISVGSGYYAIAYTGDGNDGFITTVDINASGVIGTTVDTLEFDTADGYHPQIISVASDVYAVAYRGTDLDGFVKTVDISATGVIGSVIDTIEYSPTVNAYWPAFGPAQGDYYLLAAADTGASADGFATTIQIAEVAISPAQGGVKKDGAYALEVQDATTLVGTINATTVTNAFTAGWHHVALTYDKDAGSDQMKLYIDGSLANQATLTDAITTNANDLLIGADYEGDMDELAIYSRALSAAEILSRYKRGILRMKFQIRSCDDAACSGESFEGPDDTSGTYFDELSNTALGLPTFTLSNVGDNQYVQYQVTFETDDATYSPELESVTIDYTVPGGGGGSGYPSSGTFLSNVLNSDSTGTLWDTVFWEETLLVGTDATIAVRTGNTATPDGSWSAWTSEFTDPAGGVLSLTGQYAQYRITLTTGSSSDTPTVEKVTITYR